MLDNKAAEAAEQYLFAPGKPSFYEFEYQINGLQDVRIGHSAMGFVDLLAYIVLVHGL